MTTPRIALVVFLIGVASLASGPKAIAQEAFGTIKGRLVWGVDALPKVELKVKKGDENARDAAVCAVGDIFDETFVVDPASKGVANGFAYVFSPKGSNPVLEKAILTKSPEVLVDQKNCRFVPHAVAVHKDQTLVFTSNDPVGHNVMYTGANASGNQMLASKGRLPIKFVAPERNVVPFSCSIHPWMQGEFMVFGHPFFAVTRPDGSFEIAGVPAGKQRVVVRHKEVGFITPGARQGIEIEVKACETTDLGVIKLVPKK
jgi:plastocyanin